MYQVSKFATCTEHLTSFSYGNLFPSELFQSFLTSAISSFQSRLDKVWANYVYSPNFHFPYAPFE